MDIELILDSAEIEAPGLMEAARRFLEAEARHRGVPLDPGSVMARRAEGEPEVHITAAADELLTHLLGTGDNALADEDGVFMTLARIDAQAVMTMVELEGDRNPACR